MPLLLDLPTELLQHIIDQTYHKDLVNLALTCRHINKLSQSALQHHQVLLSKYSVVSSSWRCGGVLAELTARVLREPRIGLYVSKLHIDSWCTAWSAPESESNLPVHNEYPEDTMHIVGEAGAFLEALFESKSSTWLDSFKKGDEEAVIALLLLKLANLEHLSLNAFVSCRYLEFALDYAQGRSDQGCLSRLHSVNLESDSGRSLESLNRLARIPSVRVIKISGTQSWGSPMLISPIAGRFDLDSVLLNDCRLGSKALHSFIENISGLRCFSFVFENTAFASAELYWIRAGLLTTAKDSLEYLQLIGRNRRLADDYQSETEVSEGDPTSASGSVIRFSPRRSCLDDDMGDSYVGSLRNFNVLKTLILDWEFLMNGGYDPDLYNLDGQYPQANFLARQLPSSICNLLLFVKNDTERGNKTVPYMERALKELLNESKARLSDLRILSFVGMSKPKMERLAASMLVKWYQSAGISLSYTAAENASDIEQSLQRCGYYDKTPWAPSTLPRKYFNDYR